MSVLPITIFFSLLLAGIFVVLFAQQQRRRYSSAERDSLLPLADETPRVAADHDHADGTGHDHGDGPCGCQDGIRPPCLGCLKPLEPRTPAS